MNRTLSEQRLIRNEALQRADNDQAGRTIVGIMTSDDVIMFHCECSSRACSEHIGLTNRQFLEYHRSGGHFVVKPHHERLKREKTLFSTENYRIVEKYVDPTLFSV